MYLCTFSVFLSVLSYAQRSAICYLNTPTLGGQPAVPNRPETEASLQVDICEWGVYTCFTLISAASESYVLLVPSLIRLRDASSDQAEELVATCN